MIPSNGADDGTLDDSLDSSAALPSQPSWRATARPVPPAEQHRPGRFGQSDDVSPPRRRGRLGRLGSRLASPSNARASPSPARADGRPIYVRSRGRGWVALSIVAALACWTTWLGYDLVELGSPGEPLRGLSLAAVASIAVYWLTRLAGYLMRTTWERGPRTSTLVPNAITAIFVVLCGVAFLSRTPFAISALWHTLAEQFH
ncbi:MAG TPA: hypothetical protein VHU91_01820 [Mycobacteriales bacterium]|jgi:hypothetical protein|nr:hypothetical protein [Mycobacteriales bacterium]